MITADDCGLSEGINQTTVRLHEAGIITTASLIPNFPAAQHALMLFRQYPQLEVGVHLNLSDGYPLTNLPRNSDLVRADGKFRDRYLLFARGLFPSDELGAQIKQELRAQIEFLAQAGCPPAHVTTHCHFHALPALREIVYALADEYGVQWVRSTDYRTISLPFNVNVLLARDAPQPQPHRFRLPDYLISLKHWLDQPPEQLVQELESLRGMVEIVTHPSAAEDLSFPPEVRYLPPERQRETAYLERLLGLLQQHTPTFTIRRF
jgi:predicted glycoside hydrolase/deacetylase ChbG (UPF0249 family)